MLRLALLSAILISSILFANAQRFTISGFVKDSVSGEPLISATISDKKSHGTITNAHGFYSITLERNPVWLYYSYVGYRRDSLKLYLNRDTTVNVNLSNYLLDEVVIQGNIPESIHETPQMGSFTIPIQQIETLPTLFGEVDLLKIFQLVPGVHSGSEGSSGLYVRGGGPDQNLILLDGVPIYNVNHLFGFFSIFNTDAISHVELTKGGFPARYGGRLSSVVDINMKNGNMKEVKGEGSIGLLAAKLTLEGPIQKDKASFVLSARRTYIDLLAQPFIRRQANGGKRGYYFYDANLKLNYNVNQKNKLFFSTLIGKDKGHLEDEASFVDDDLSFRINDKSGLQWGNFINALRWNRVLSPRLFGNLTVTYSQYRFNISRDYYEETISSGGAVEQLSFGSQYKSGIEDWAVKLDFDFSSKLNHAIKFGVSNIFHKFSPGVYAYSSSVEGDTLAGAKVVRPIELAGYFEDEFSLSKRIQVNAGIHVSGFYVERKWYYSIQPRFSSRFLLRRDFSLKASYSRMTQYLHLLTNVGIGLPTDLWVPSTSRIKPQQASQIAVGMAKTFGSSYELSTEVYWKEMSNLIEYKDGASYLNVSGDWQDKVADDGNGRNIGLEILLRKKTGNTTGWIGYTISRTTRQFDQLNFGETYPYKYDRLHDISLAVIHNWNKNINLSLVWVYGSGNALTLPQASYQTISDRWDSGYVNTSSGYYYGDRNSYRARSYHRLDLSVNFVKEKNWGERTWAIAIYNVYNRLNPFFIDIARENGSLKFVEYSLFPIMPSISYSFKF